MQSGNMRFVQAAKLLFKTEGVSVRSKHIPLKVRALIY